MLKKREKEAICFFAIFKQWALCLRDSSYNNYSYNLSTMAIITSLKSHTLMWLSALAENIWSIFSPYCASLCSSMPVPLNLDSWLSPSDKLDIIQLQTLFCAKRLSQLHNRPTDCCCQSLKVYRRYTVSADSQPVEALWGLAKALLTLRGVRQLFYMYTVPYISAFHSFLVFALKLHLVPSRI